jgi:hypothetical protein
MLNIIVVSLVVTIFIVVVALWYFGPVFLLNIPFIIQEGRCVSFLGFKQDISYNVHGLMLFLNVKRVAVYLQEPDDYTYIASIRKLYGSDMRLVQIDVFDNSARNLLIRRDTAICNVVQYWLGKGSINKDKVLYVKVIE